MEYLLFFGFILLIGALARSVQNAQFDASKPIGNLAAWRSRRIVNPKTGATVVQWSQAIYANGVHPLQPDAERWITSWTEWAEYPRPVNTPPSPGELE